MNILRKLFLTSLNLFSLFFLSYVIYRSEIQWGGERREYYFFYYIISSILIFFSIITFFLNKKIKDYLAISAFSILLSFYLFEVYSSLTDQLGTKSLNLKRNNMDYDRRTKFEIYKDLKKSNINIKVFIHPASYLDLKTNFLPLSGISNSETIHCNEDGYYSIYYSDRHGFNNPNEEWDKDKVEYLLVGDSFTHGACVNRNNDIGSVLRNLSKKSVLNLGYTGNGPLMQYATLREYLNPKIKKVLWIFFEGNDLIELKKELSHPVLKNYLNDLNFTQNLKKRQIDIDNFANISLEKAIKEEGKKAKDKYKEEKEENKNLKHKILNFITFKNLRTYLNIQNIIYSIQKKQADDQTEFKKILKLVKNLTSNYGSDLYFVYIPDYSRYLIKNPNNRNYFLVKKIVDDLDIAFIDIHEEVLKKEKNPFDLFPFKGGHFNIEGYKKISETIYKFSKE
tara:strand:+ start:2487 stop:3842 length:1356 start_codon:yes stop_codon:yes gene_type:complete